MVRACDEKRGTLCSKEMKVQGRRKRGRPKRRWLDRVISKRRDCRLMKCTTVLHGRVCHRTSTPHKSWNKMKEKKIYVCVNMACIDITIMETDCLLGWYCYTVETSDIVFSLSVANGD